MSATDKRAALELHNLAPRDREWVLGRLPDAERARLAPLLAELDGMHIRFDLDSAALPLAAVSESPEAPAPASGGRSPQQEIRAAAAKDVARVLAAEPAWLVRAVLTVEAWPWLAPVCAALQQQGVLRQQAPRLSGAVPLPAAQAAALLALLAERLRDAAAAHGLNGHGGHMSGRVNGKVSGRVNGHANGHAGALAGGSGWGRVWPKVRQWLP